MSEANWKYRERAIAKRLGGRRVPNDGSRGGADILSPRLAVQSKRGYDRPAYLAEWLESIRAAGDRHGLAGAVVWSVRDEKVDDNLVVMRLGDLADILEDLRHDL